MPNVMARNTPDQGIRNPRETLRYSKAGIGAWQTLPRTPTADSERLLSAKSENILRISRARPRRRPLILESRRPGRTDGA